MASRRVTLRPNQTCGGHRVFIHRRQCSYIQRILGGNSSIARAPDDFVGFAKQRYRDWPMCNTDRLVCWRVLGGRTAFTWTGSRGQPLTRKAGQDSRVRGGTVSQGGGVSASAEGRPGGARGQPFIRSAGQDHKHRALFGRSADGRSASTEGRRGGTRGQPFTRTDGESHRDRCDVFGLCAGRVGTRPEGG